MIGSSSPRAAFETLLIIGALLAHLAFLPHDIFSDGLRRYRELDDLLRHGVVSQDKYSLIGPLFAAPLWLLGQIVRGPMWWVARFNLAIFALGLLAIYLILKDKVDRSLIRRFLLILAVASMFPFPLTSFYGETFTAITLGVGVLAVVFGPTVLGWAAVALGVANTAATVVGMALAVVTRAVQTGRLRVFAALAGAGVLMVVENLVRHHSLTNSRYEDGFTFPVFFGVLSILFSFGKGLIFFAPAIFFPARRYFERAGSAGLKLYRAYLMLLAFLVGMVAVYAGWYVWSGNWFWGPRFFLLAALPCSLALAARLHRPGASTLPGNLLTLGLLALCSWVGINGAVFDVNALVGPCGRVTGKICVYLPQNSALWYPLVSPHWLPGIKPLLYLGFSLVVVAYLAAPLVLTIARQTGVALRSVLATFRAARAGIAIEE